MKPKHIFLIIFLIPLLTSCHSKYLNLGIRTDGTIVWNKDSTAFVFVARKKLYKRPKGIATFPDGGKTKNEFLDFSLCYYNIKHNQLSCLADLNEFYQSMAYRWLSISQVKLSLSDTVLYYRMIQPYDYDLKTIKERKPDLLTMVNKTYKVNLITLKKETIDTVFLHDLFKNKRKRFNKSIASQYLQDLKCSDWGIELSEIHPQSKKMYSNYIIEKEGNEAFRECIFQQVISSFSKKDREYIVEQMKKKEKELYNIFKKTDKIKNPYQRSLREEKYNSYIEYMKIIEYKLNN
ncbi:MAG: hypothetical protein U9R42_11205 [Bacteroidota bacterium]|nr:hypothetical protein [Bacteroidota bacterium]